ncbi:MAG TPA: BamA/TamA family outer membrane protein [Chitinispirillaceae bacterium]|nr:BamA/TamA family outer membrane protein [Chitinispirillaceae bacterium]
MKNSKIVITTLLLFTFFHNLLADNSDIHVASITIHGNETFSTDTLLSLMETRKPFLFWKTTYSDFKLHEDINAITVFYRSHGFINPVVTHEQRFDSSDNKVHIEITIEENKRIKVSSISITNDSIFDIGIISTLNSRIGEPLIYPFVNSDARKLIDTLANTGFLKASVKPVLEIDSTSFTAAISFIITPGPCIFVNDIRIEGLSTVERTVVSRELTFKKGDTLTSRHIKKSQLNLFQTRMFNFVDIFADISDSVSFLSSADTFITVVVSVNQARYFSIDAGVRYGTYERLYSSINLSYNNLFRKGHSIGLSGLLSGFEQSIELYYVFPWIFGIPFDLTIRPYYRRHDTLFLSIPLAYEGEFNGFSFNIGRNFNDIFLFDIAFEYENVLRISIPEVDSLTEDIPTTNNRSIIVNLTYDKRNDIINPVKGFLEQMTFRIGGLGGSGANRFFKITNNFHLYFKAGYFIITSGVAGGWAQTYGQSESVPIQYQFFGGGPQTVRGYPRDKLITTSSGDPSGGNVELILHFFDIQFPLFWLFYGAIFLDAGYIWSDIGSVKLSDIKFTAGPALRLNTPVGMIRIDSGFQLHRMGKKDSYQIHLGIGRPF